MLLISDVVIAVCLLFIFTIKLKTRGTYMTKTFNLP